MLFYHAPKGNFGDDLNRWIWDFILPGWRNWAPETTLVGVGTLINEVNLAPYKTRKLLILGSGVGYGNESVPKLEDQWDIVSLRGKESARQLGLDERLGLIDPATMLSEFTEFKTVEKGTETTFVPHWQSTDFADWTRICCRLGIKYLSPCEDAKHVIRKIASSQLVIAESMHAAIIADTFRVPWIPVSIGPQFHYRKWQDFLQQVRYPHPIRNIFERLPQVPKKIGPLSTRGFSIKITNKVQAAFAKTCLSKAMTREPFLSADALLSAGKEQYLERVESVIKAYGP